MATAMSTTTKGEDFEATVYGLLKEDIDSGALGLKPECCRLIKKAKYFSKDRDGDIIFDMAIEIFLSKDALQTDSTRPIFIVLIECKCYSGPIPVSDVEEFYSKIQQVSGHKGFFVSNSSLQTGAFKFATSKHIGFARVFDNKSLSWQLNRPADAYRNISIDINEINLKLLISDENYKSKFLRICFYVDDRYFHSIRDFVDYFICRDNVDLPCGYIQALKINSSGRAQLEVKYLHKLKIEELADFLRRTANYKNGEVDLEEVYSANYARDGFVLNMDKTEPRGNTLGRLSFKEKRIYIYPCNHANKEQERFTFAHEIGHIALGHASYMTEESSTDKEVTTSRLALDVNNVGAIGRMEWQANYFASCLLLPRSNVETLTRSIATKIGLRDRGFGLLYLDHQPENQTQCRRVIREIRNTFKASYSATKYRLQDIGLLTDNTEQIATRDLTKGFNWL
jgi:Zn-dependent peptidase ImmA (M78 family)